MLKHRPEPILTAPDGSTRYLASTALLLTAVDHPSRVTRAAAVAAAVPADRLPASPVTAFASANGLSAR